MSPMSSSHVPDDGIALPTYPADAASHVRAVVATLVLPLRLLGFWIGVLTPVAYLPLLGGGLGAGQTLLFFALLCLQALGLVVGRNHARGRTDT